MATSSDTTLVPLHRLAPEPVDEPDPDPTTCPECGGRLHTADRETACEACGLVTATHYLDRSERPYYPSDGNPDPRHTFPTTAVRHDRGLGSEIGGADDLPYRLRRWHTRTRMGSKADRNRAYAFGELRRVADRLDQPRVVVETASQLFEQAQDAGLGTGRSLDGLAAAAFAAAARVHDAPVTRSDVLEYGRVDRQTLASHYDALNRELDVPIPPPSPRVLVGRVCDGLELDAAVRTDAEAVVDAVNGLATSGRNPWSVAGAAVYLAAGGQRNGRVTQADVADAAGVTPVTLRSVAKSLSVEGEDGE